MTQLQLQRAGRQLTLTQPQLQPLQLADILDSVRQMFQTQAADKGLQLEFAPPPPLPGPLLGDALAIIDRQPRTEGEGRIFPVHPQTLSKYFKAACDALGIADLHFHDLRHEGTSRLFEDGFAVQEVALVTGHKSWAHLKRYTNLRPESLHQRAAGAADE